MRRLLLFACLCASPALGQTPQPLTDPLPPMKMPPATVPDTPATTAYKAAMAKMDRGMAIPYTGNADRDFVNGMIPHHDGAIDMARVELLYGKDPALKKLAQQIIAAQQQEIATMQKWQASHPR
jgi:uncharacterized protein (DUF305 family)